MAKPNPLSLAAHVAESMKAPEKPKAAPPLAAAPETIPAKSSREGKRFLGYYVEPTRHEEIKQAALDEGIQIQEVLRQAVDAWMQANGADAVAAVEQRRARRAKR